MGRGPPWKGGRGRGPGGRGYAGKKQKAASQTIVRTDKTIPKVSVEVPESSHGKSIPPHKKDQLAKGARSGTSAKKSGTKKIKAVAGIASLDRVVVEDDDPPPPKEIRVKSFAEIMAEKKKRRKSEEKKTEGDSTQGLTRSPAGKIHRRPRHTRDVNADNAPPARPMSKEELLAQVYRREAELAYMSESDTEEPVGDSKSPAHTQIEGSVQGSLSAESGHAEDEDTFFALHPDPDDEFGSDEESGKGKIAVPISVRDPEAVPPDRISKRRRLSPPSSEDPANKGPLHHAHRLQGRLSNARQSKAANNLRQNPNMRENEKQQFWSSDPGTQRRISVHDRLGSVNHRDVSPPPNRVDSEVDSAQGVVARDDRHPLPESHLFQPHGGPPVELRRHTPNNYSTLQNAETRQPENAFAACNGKPLEVRLHSRNRPARDDGASQTGMDLPRHTPGRSSPHDHERHSTDTRVQVRQLSPTNPKTDEPVLRFNRVTTREGIKQSPISTRSEETSNPRVDNHLRSAPPLRLSSQGSGLSDSSPSNGLSTLQGQLSLPNMRGWDSSMDGSVLPSLGVRDAPTARRLGFRERKRLEEAARSIAVALQNGVASTQAEAQSVSSKRSTEDEPMSQEIDSGHLPPMGRLQNVNASSDNLAPDSVLPTATIKFNHDTELAARITDAAETHGDNEIEVTEGDNQLRVLGVQNKIQLRVIRSAAEVAAPPRPPSPTILALNNERNFPISSNARSRLGMATRPESTMTSAALHDGPSKREVEFTKKLETHTEQNDHDRPVASVGAGRESEITSSESETPSALTTVSTTSAALLATLVPANAATIHEVVHRILTEDKTKCGVVYKDLTEHNLIFVCGVNTLRLISECCRTSDVSQSETSLVWVAANGVYAELEKRAVTTPADRLSLLEVACRTQNPTFAFNLLQKMHGYGDLALSVDGLAVTFAARAYLWLCDVADTESKWWSTIATSYFRDTATADQEIVNRIAEGLSSSASERVPHFVREAVDRNVQPTTKSYATVLMSQLTRGDVCVALDMVHDLLRCDKSVLESAPLAGKPLGQLCLDCVTSLGKEYFDDALDLYSFLCQQSPETVSESLTDAMGAACIKMLSVSRMILFFESASMAGATIKVTQFCEAAQVCLRKLDERVHQVYLAAKSQSVDAASTTFPSAIAVFTQCGQFDLAVRVMSEQEAVGITLDSDTFGCLVTALAEREEWEILVSQLQTGIPRLSDQTLRDVARVLGQKHRGDIIQELLAMSSESNIPLPTCFYSQILSQLVLSEQGNAFPENFADQVYEHFACKFRMDVSGGTLPEMTNLFSSMLTLCIMRKRTVENVVQVASDAAKSGAPLTLSEPVAEDAALILVEHCHFVEAAYVVRSRYAAMCIDQTVSEMSPQLLHTLIRSLWSRADNRSTATAVLSLVDVSTLFNAKYHPELLDVLLALDEHDVVVSALERVIKNVQLSMEDYGKISSYLATQSIGPTEVLRGMKVFLPDSTPPPELLNSMLTAAITRADWLAGRAILSACKYYHLESDIDRGLLLSLLRGFCESNEPKNSEIARTYFKNALAHGSDLYPPIWDQSDPNSIWSISLGSLTGQEMTWAFEHHIDDLKGRALSDVRELAIDLRPRDATCDLVENPKQVLFDCLINVHSIPISALRGDAGPVVFVSREQVAKLLGVPITRKQMMSPLETTSESLTSGVITESKGKGKARTLNQAVFRDKLAQVFTTSTKRYYPHRFSAVDATIKKADFKHFVRKYTKHYLAKYPDVTTVTDAVTAQVDRQVDKYFRDHDSFASKSGERKTQRHDSI